MGLALVMVKEHARRAVHLGHNNALGAVNDERAVVGHQGHIAHEHVLFLDVLDTAGAGGFIDIKHDQTQGDFQRGGIGHVALLALVHVILRLFQLVFHELENGGFVEILDRKHRLEGALQAFAVQGLWAIARAQEQVIRGFLNLDQVRHVQNFANLAEIPADTLLANVSLSHARRYLSSFPRHTSCRATGARRLGIGGKVPFMPAVPSAGSRTLPRLGRGFAQKPLPRREKLEADFSAPSLQILAGANAPEWIT